MNPALIRAELERRLATISGLHSYSEWPDKPEVPAACITSGDVRLSPYESLGLARLMTYSLVVTVAVSAAASVDDAERALDASMEPVLDAVRPVSESDPTWGGLIQSAWCTEISGTKQVPIAGGGLYLGFEVPVSIVVRHS